MWRESLIFALFARNTIMRSDSSQNTESEDKWLEILEVCEKEDFECNQAKKDGEMGNSIQPNSKHKPGKPEKRRLFEVPKEEIQEMSVKEKNRTYQIAGSNQKVYDDIKFLIDGLSCNLPENTRCLSLCEIIPKCTDHLLAQMLVEYSLLSRVYKAISICDFCIEPDFSLCASAFILLQLSETGGSYTSTGAIEILLKILSNKTRHHSSSIQARVMLLIPKNRMDEANKLPKSYSLIHKLVCMSLLLYGSHRPPKKWKPLKNHQWEAVISLLLDFTFEMMRQIYDLQKPTSHKELTDYNSTDENIEQWIIITRYLSLIFCVMEAYPALNTRPDFIINIIKRLDVHCLAKLQPDEHSVLKRVQLKSFWMNLMKILALLTHNQNETVKQIYRLESFPNFLSFLILQIPNLEGNKIDFDNLLMSLTVALNLVDLDDSSHYFPVIGKKLTSEAMSIWRSEMSESLIKFTKSLKPLLASSRKQINEEIHDQNPNEIACKIDASKIEKLCDLASENMEVNVCAAHISMLLANLWQQNTISKNNLDEDSREILPLLCSCLKKFIDFSSITMLNHFDMKKAKEKESYLNQLL